MTKQLFCYNIYIYYLSAYRSAASFTFPSHPPPPPLVRIAPGPRVGGAPRTVCVACVPSFRHPSPRPADVVAPKLRRVEHNWHAAPAIRSPRRANNITGAPPPTPRRRVIVDRYNNTIVVSFVLVYSPCYCSLFSLLLVTRIARQKIRKNKTKFARCQSTKRSRSV